jgi:hypothetical protein
LNAKTAKEATQSVDTYNAFWNYSSPSIIRVIKSRRMGWAEHVARMKDKRNAYRVFFGKPDGKRQIDRPRRRWVDNITIALGR